MTFLKLVTYFNWAVLALLGLLVVLGTLFPGKSGGESYGRALSSFYYYLAIIGLVILLVLNYLPFNWGKYLAFGLVVIPIFLAQISPLISSVKRRIGHAMQASKPIFEDNEREQIARAIQHAQIEKLKMLLQSPVPNLNKDGELLAFAVYEANGATYRLEEKLTCIRLLFEAGAQLDSTATDSIPIHFAVAETGCAPLMRFLLEKGANANAVHKYSKRAILFEAIGSYQEPEATVRALLEYGADPNVYAVLDDETGPVSALYRAGELERWGVCLVLLEKGANPDFVTKNGQTLRQMLQKIDQEYPKDGYSRQADFEQLKSRLK